ncbi:MAG: transcription antitermination factor NusB [Synergistaceae bacterium]|nr:transcription antitermination factor NusB [Synergistaceae bacterium]
MSRSFLPQKRHRSREMALQMLYSLDLRRNQTLEDAFEFFAAEEDPEILNYARDLTKGAWEARNDIDNLIREHVTGWRPERMVAVDRAALRMAIYECLLTSLTPVPVAISEAVELAKTFGTEESGKFVNGVLGKIVRALPPPVEDEKNQKEQDRNGKET